MFLYLCAQIKIIETSVYMYKFCSKNVGKKKAGHIVRESKEKKRRESNPCYIYSCILCLYISLICFSFSFSLTMLHIDRYAFPSSSRLFCSLCSLSFLSSPLSLQLSRSFFFFSMYSCTTFRRLMLEKKMGGIGSPFMGERSSRPSVGCVCVYT